MNAKIAIYNQQHLNKLSTDITVNQETPKTSFLAKTKPRASWAGLKGYQDSKPRWNDKYL